MILRFGENIKLNTLTMKKILLIYFDSKFIFDSTGLRYFQNRRRNCNSKWSINPTIILSRVFKRSRDIKRLPWF